MIHRSLINMVAMKTVAKPCHPGRSDKGVSPKVSSPPPPKPTTRDRLASQNPQLDFFVVADDPTCSMCASCGTVSRRKQDEKITIVREPKKMSGYIPLVRKCKHCTSAVYRFFSKVVTDHKRRYAEIPRKHVSVTVNDLMVMWSAQNGKCAVTGLPMSFSGGDVRLCSVDRVNSGKGYSADNVQLLCLWVNRGKNTMDNDCFLHEFRAAAQSFTWRKPTKA
jgi:hypothetical protein